MAHNPGPRRKVVSSCRSAINFYAVDVTLDCGHVVYASYRNGKPPKTSACYKCGRESKRFTVKPYNYLGHRYPVFRNDNEFVADFVTEEEANDYAAYRNDLLRKLKTDKLPVRK